MKPLLCRRTVRRLISSSFELFLVGFNSVTTHSLERNDIVTLRSSIIHFCSMLIQLTQRACAAKPFELAPPQNPGNIRLIQIRK